MVLLVLAAGTTVAGVVGMHKKKDAGGATPDQISVSDEAKSGL